MNVKNRTIFEGDNLNILQGNRTQAELIQVLKDQGVLRE